MQREKGLDIRVKQQLRKPVIFCDLIHGGLFCGEQRLHPEMLQRMPEILNYSEEQTEREYRSYERIPDVVYAAGAGEGYLVLMDENQNCTDYAMPLRNMFDTAIAYMQQKKTIEKAHKEAKDLKTGGEYLSGFAKQDRLHPVIFLTFYHGEEPWKGGSSLHDILKFPEGLEDMKQFCPDFRMNLIHAWNVNPENFRTGLRAVFELLPVAADRKGLKDYVKGHTEHFGNLTEEECDLLEVFIGMKKLGKGERETYRNENGGYNMCTALMDIREEGIAAGESALSKLARLMQADGREKEFFECCGNDKKRKKLYKEYGII